MSMTSRRIHEVSHLTGIAVVMLCGAAAGAAAQGAPRVVRDTALAATKLIEVREAAPAAEPVVVAEARAIASNVPGVWYVFDAQNVPPDVRIMQTIVRTALSQVEPPRMPSGLGGDSAGDAADTSGVYVVAPRASFVGRGDVSGFYMQGYGYVFTVNWPVGVGVSFFNAQAARIAEATADQQVALESARAKLEQFTAQGEAGAKADAKQRERAQAEVQREVQRQRQVRVARLQSDQARTKEMDAWTAQYRQRLSDALRDAIAGYGSTLRRARPGEAITFIADFGGGNAETVTMTVKAGALHGSNLDANRSAIQISRGQGDMSARLSTQLKIMSQIIDTSLRPDASDQGVMGGVWSTYFGGTAQTQYVPGYGVIFRKSARLNTARAFASFAPMPLRERSRTALDSTESKARKSYQEHLDTLKRKTAEILATYGPTLTELKDADWVGINYDVGSAAALLGNGGENYLVQARMRDVRQAAAQSDPAGWLAQRLVTNEKGD